MFILQAPTSSSRVEMTRLALENVGITHCMVWQLISLILLSNTIADMAPSLTQTVTSEQLALFVRMQISMKDCGSAFVRSTYM